MKHSKGAYKSSLKGPAFLGSLVAAGVVLGFIIGYTFMETADVILFKKPFTLTAENHTNLPRQLSVVDQQHVSTIAATLTVPSPTPSPNISPPPLSPPPLSPVSSPLPLPAASASPLPPASSPPPATNDAPTSVSSTPTTSPVSLASSSPSSSPSTTAPAPAAKKWPGKSIHSVLTSGGDNYQNYQTRVFWSSYQLVKKMPGGEHLTGFTRILHAVNPDFLMKEIPTYMANEGLKNGYDYPVKNRPIAILQWLRAAEKDPNMIQGAWIAMLECDYVWFRPLLAPGDAYDRNVIGVQYQYDYIYPAAEDLAPCISKFYGAGDRSIIPRSGPAPVVMRLDEWMKVGPNYANVSAAIESDNVCKEKLGWVREMYAWDIAITLIRDLKIETSKTPQSLLIGQPPFEESRGNAAMYHYTWGPYYYDTKQNKKLIYKWEKRDIQSIQEVLKPSLLPLPPPFQEGILLEFDVPLNVQKHNIVVDFINVMNEAIKNVVPMEMPTPNAQ